jgi:hypothetical protein
MARVIVAGRNSRVGGSTSQATRMKASIAAGSYSAAVNTRSTYGLTSLVDSGGEPSISGSDRSFPITCCQACRIGFAPAR